MRNVLKSFCFHSGNQKVILYPIICIDYLWNRDVLYRTPSCLVINMCTTLLVFLFAYLVSFSSRQFLFSVISTVEQNSEARNIIWTNSLQLALCSQLISGREQRGAWQNRTLKSSFAGDSPGSYQVFYFLQVSIKCSNQFICDCVFFFFWMEKKSFNYTRKMQGMNKFR